MRLLPLLALLILCYVPPYPGLSMPTSVRWDKDYIPH